MKQLAGCQATSEWQSRELTFRLSTPSTVLIPLCKWSSPKKAKESPWELI